MTYLGFLTAGRQQQAQRSCLQATDTSLDSRNGMTAKTRNIFIFGIMTIRIKIPVANLDFLTMHSLIKKVLGAIQIQTLTGSQK